MKAPRIAIPEPNLADSDYSARSWPQYARAVEFAGGEPVMLTAVASHPQFDDPTLQHIAETPGLPPDVVRGLIALARNWRDQADQAEGVDDLVPDEEGRQRPERRGA